MMHTLFWSKIKLQFPFISRAVSQPSDSLPRQQKKQSQLALPFCWCGRRDCDSRRELRGLVVRGSDSHLGCHSTPLLLQVHHPYKTKTTRDLLELFCLVRETGLEPVRWKHTPLKRARLPIPPLPRTLILYHIDFRLSIGFSKIFLFFCKEKMLTQNLRFAIINVSEKDNKPMR